MRTLLSIVGTSCLVFAVSSCTSSPKPAPGTTPASKESLETFEAAAKRACSSMFLCFKSGAPGSPTRVERAADTFPEYGHLCLHEAKARARLKPAGDACVTAATSYMNCRTRVSCDEDWAVECGEERTTARNLCGDFLGSETPLHRN